MSLSICESEAFSMFEFINGTLMQNFRNSDKIERTFFKQRGNASIPYCFTTRARIFDAPPVNNDTAQRLFGYMQEVFLTGTTYKELGCSDTKEHYQASFEEIQTSTASKLAGEALYDRKYHYYQLSEIGIGNKMHETVQNHFIYNDPLCVAIELPVWSEEQNRSGFIDIVRLWDDRVIICDFKPRCAKEKVNKVMTQLIHYRQLLSERTGISESLMDCLYFDHLNCYKLI